MSGQEQYQGCSCQCRFSDYGSNGNSYKRRYDIEADLADKQLKDNLVSLSCWFVAEKRL